MRILITGGPSTGKTTLARRLSQQHGIPVFHSDDLIGIHHWSGASDEVKRWIEQPGPWIIEGVAVPRALRKWYAEHGEQGTPADSVIWLQEPHIKHTPGQATMAKGLQTVWEQVQPLLEGSGVPIRGRAD